MAKEETVRFLVTVPKSLHEKAKRAAINDRRDLSNWVRVAMESKLDTIKNEPVFARCSEDFFDHLIKGNIYLVKDNGFGALVVAGINGPVLVPKKYFWDVENDDLAVVESEDD